MFPNYWQIFLTLGEVISTELIPALLVLCFLHSLTSFILTKIPSVAFTFRLRLSHLHVSQTRHTCALKLLRRNLIEGSWRSLNHKNKTPQISFGPLLIFRRFYFIVQQMWTEKPAVNQSLSLTWCKWKSSSVLVAKTNISVRWSRQTNKRNVR